MISGLTAFRNDVICLEGRVLMGSNEEFRSDIDQRLRSDSWVDDSLDQPDGQVGELACESKGQDRH